MFFNRILAGFKANNVIIFFTYWASYRHLSIIDYAKCLSNESGMLRHNQMLKFSINCPTTNTYILYINKINMFAHRPHPYFHINTIAIHLPCIANDAKLNGSVYPIHPCSAPKKRNRFNDNFWTKASIGKYLEDKCWYEFNLQLSFKYFVNWKSIQKLFSKVS